MTANRLPALPTFSTGTARSRSPLLSLIVLMGGTAVGLVTAFLVVQGEWQIALGLIAIVPGLIIIHKYPFLAVLAWLFLVPFLLHTETASLRMVYWVIHRGLPPLTLGLMVISNALRVRPRSFPRPGVPEVAMAGYLIVSVLSIILLNSNPLATFYLYYDRVIVPMCLYTIIRLTAPGEKVWQWLLPIALFISVSQSAIGLLAWVAPGVLPSSWLENQGERTIGSLINAAIYTSTLTFSGLLLLHAAFNTPQKWLRNIFILTFLLSMYSIFISFSRASWLGAILVIMGLLYLYPKFMVKLGLLAVPVMGLILSGALLSSQLNWAEERLYSDEAEVSALARLPIFYAAVAMFQEKPFFGWGYNNFDVYDRAFYGRVLDLPHDNKDHASHNLYLTLVAEQGATGLLLYLTPMFWLLWLSIKRLPDLPRNGFRSRKLLIILWLVIGTHVIVSNFMNIIVVYGLGVWWITLALIATLVDGRFLPIPGKIVEFKIAPPQDLGPRRNLVWFQRSTR